MLPSTKKKTCFRSRYKREEERVLLFIARYKCRVNPESHVSLSSIFQRYRCWCQCHRRFLFCQLFKPPVPVSGDCWKFKLRCLYLFRHFQAVYRLKKNHRRCRYHLHNFFRAADARAPLRTSLPVLVRVPDENSTATVEVDFVTFDSFRRRCRCRLPVWAPISKLVLSSVCFCM